ncbi:MAG: sulfotransferase [Methylocella sp.]
MHKDSQAERDPQVEFVTIVSGLPRSGTSMMMRMLEAGGMPVVIDHDRKPDADNPNGYYEFEPIKKLKEDSSWVAGAAGRVVKAIYLLLYDLPGQHQYRVILMRRDLTEVIASQDAMLRRSGSATGGLDPKMLARHYETQLRHAAAWLREQPNFAVTYVNYADIVQNPAAAAAAVASFLGGAVDPVKMAASVDRDLYRQRAASLTAREAPEWHAPHLF